MTIFFAGIPGLRGDTLGPFRWGILRCIAGCIGANAGLLRRFPGSPATFHDRKRPTGLPVKIRTQIFLFSADLSIQGNTACIPCVGEERKKAGPRGSCDVDSSEAFLESANATNLRPYSDPLAFACCIWTDESLSRSGVWDRLDGPKLQAQYNTNGTTLWAFQPQVTA